MEKGCQKSRNDENSPLRHFSLACQKRSRIDCYAYQRAYRRGCEEVFEDSGTWSAIFQNSLKKSAYTGNKKRLVAFPSLKYMVESIRLQKNSNIFPLKLTLMHFCSIISIYKVGRCFSYPLGRKNICQRLKSFNGALPQILKTKCKTEHPIWFLFLFE